MGSSDGKYGLEHALGKVSIPRVTSPTLRGSVRRANPDGGHASPYFLGLNTKTLTLEVSPVVGDILITFVSDDMDDAISTINAASPANLKATDDDGYLRLTNLNTGSKNKIIIKGGTSVDILGFVVAPEPGSASFAGDLATSAPGRSVIGTQNNPQGTALVAQDEDLTSAVLNRSIFGGLRHVERVLRSLDIEVPVIKRIPVTVVTHVPTGKKVFVIQEAELRFPIQGFEISGNPAPPAVFDKLITLRTNITDVDVVDPLNASSFPRVTAVYYNDGSNATANANLNFTTWGTIDGKSIFASQTINKQAPAAITAIRGNILVVPTALFLTNVCQPGDTLVIEGANNNVPFNHNGEFIIVEVLSETKVAVRPKSEFEATFISTEKPSELNLNLPGGTVYGNARVVIGATIPMTNMMFEVDSWVPLGAYFARVLTYKRIGDLQFQELGESLNPGNAGLGAVLNTHFTGLAAHSSLNITADAVAGAPFSLGAGTVDAQTATIIGFLNTLTAANVAYAGGGAWADGTTNPATTVELQLDKIITDLSGSGGAIKIGANSGPNWADGVTNPAATVEARLDKIITDLAANSGAIKIGANTGPNWADGTTNPAASVEARLDKIVTDLAGATGSGKVQGVVVGTDLAVGTVQAQLADLAVNWLKLSRANTIVGAQTFSAIITANGGININGNLEVDDILAHGDVLLDGSTVDVSGTLQVVTDYKHLYNRVLNIPGAAGLPIGGANTLSGSVIYPTAGFEGAIEATATITTILWSIPLTVGDRVKTVTIRVKSTSGGTLVGGIGSGDVIIRTNAGGSTFIGSTGGAVNVTSAIMNITIDTTDHTLVTGDVLLVALSNAVNDVYVQNVQVTYDHP